MKKSMICLLCLLPVVCSLAQKQFVVDPNAEMRSLQKSFTSIKVSGSIDVYLSQGEVESVAVSASEENMKPHIKTVVEDNTLRVFSDGDKSWRKKRKMVVYISFINLITLDVSGASDITVAGTIKVPSLKLLLSGASDFKGEVQSGSLEMHLSGASDMKISGTVSNLDIESSGASDVDGFDLTTEICSAKASGASDINVTVNKELNAHASGASNIFYRGSGVIKDIQRSGASTVAKKGS